MRSLPTGATAASGLPILVTIQKGLTTLRFTSADRSITIDSDTWVKAPGADLTGIQFPSDGSTSNADVTISAVAGGLISPGDAARGVLDNWPIDVTFVDPNTSDTFPIISGTIGSADENANALVTLAVNGPLRFAQERPICEHFSLICRADLGDDRCKIPILLNQTVTFYDIQRSTAYVRPDFEAGILTEFGLAHVTDAYGRVVIGTSGTIDDYSNVHFECQTAGTTAATAPTFPTSPGSTVTDGTVVWVCRDAWFRHARAQAIDAFTIQLSSFSDSRAGDPTWFIDGGIFFRSGALGGFEKIPVKSWDPGTQRLTLFLPVSPSDVPAGTQCEVQPGCDRTRDQCFLRFNNIVNGRFETFVPPPDAVLSI